MSDQPQPENVDRLDQALNESRRVEKELNARDVQKDAEFADRLAERMEKRDAEEDAG